MTPERDSPEALATDMDLIPAAPFPAVAAHLRRLVALERENERLRAALERIAATSQGHIGHAETIAREALEKQP